MEILGYVGLVSLALCWFPQSWETIRTRRCSVNLSFLLLSTLGGLTLTIYSVWRNDPVFTLLNGLTTAGSLLNLFYKLRPASR